MAHSKKLAAKVEQLITAVLQLGPLGEDIAKNALSIKDMEHQYRFLATEGKRLSDRMRGLEKYHEEAVDVKKFIESPDYLGMENVLYPKVMDEVIEFNHGDYEEGVFTGGIGTGKTTVALISTCYQLYLLSLLKNPHKELSIAPSDEIVFIFQSLSASLSKAVDYERFREMTENSPYFREQFPFDTELSSMSKFPNRILVKPVSGESTAAIGQNVIGGILDECLVGTSQIETPEGTRTISLMVVGDKVYSYDQLGRLVEDTVVERKNTGQNIVYKIELRSGKTITCTENHPIATPQGWQDAGTLDIGDEVYASTQRPGEVRSLAEAFERTQAQVQRGGFGTSSAENGRNEQGEGKAQEAKGEKAKVRHGGVQQVGEYEEVKIGVQPEAKSEMVQGGSVEAIGITQGQKALQGDKGETIQGSCGVHDQEGLHGEVPVQIEEMHKDEVPVNLRGAGDKVDGCRSEGIESTVREGESTIHVGGYSENHGCGLSSDHRGGGVPLGGEKLVWSEDPASEVSSNEEVRPEEWSHVYGVGRDVVVRVTKVGYATTYNIETEKYHNYIADGVLTHNCNFMQVIEKSKQSRDGGTYNQAWENYRAIVRRRESRFMKQGKMPGRLCLVSSKQYPGEFTDIKTQEAYNDIARYGKSKIFVYDKRAWEVKPLETFSPGRFSVFIGDETRKPRILADDEEVSLDDTPLVMEIPEDYKSQFESDLLPALRDIAGVATLALHPFMLDTEKVAACFGSVKSVLSRDDCDFKVSQLKIYPNMFKHKDRPRFAHIDLSMSGDCTGVACGYVKGFRKVKRGENEYETLPEIVFDFTLRVIPPKNEDIQFHKIRTLFYKLRDLGLPVKWVTLDTFQSTDTLQLMTQKGFKTGIQSMDVTTHPYDITKTAFMDGRLQIPVNKVAQDEVVKLERDPKTNKIDHPPNGSKDISDAIAGVVYGLTMRRESWLSHGVPLTEIPKSLKSKTTDGKRSMDDQGEKSIGGV